MQLAWSSAETKYFTDWAKNTSVDKDDYYGDEVLLTSYVADTGTVESSVKNNDGKSWTVKYRAKDQNQLYTFIIDEKGDVSRKAGIELDKEKIVLQIVDGEAIPVDLNATVEALQGEIEWKIEGIEEVKVTMTLSEGNTKATLIGIEATTENVIVIATCEGKSATCEVSVKRTTHVSSISINPTETTVNRESTQTIIATVNAGATEILDWEISAPESEDVEIVETNVNTENNTQTITIKILKTAISEEQITVIAKSPFNENVNASATLTVNVPVTEISITPNKSVKISKSGTQSFTATITPSDATNRTINWTIEHESATGLIKYQNNSSTGITISGNTIKVITGENEGTAIIRATSAVDSTKTVTVGITIGEVLGYFKQDGTKAYYYPSLISTENEREEITETNMGLFLGKKVKYQPSSPFSDIATSTIYRLFYIDVNGNFGDGQGTIYLKQECGGGSKEIANNETQLDNLYNGLDNSANKMAQLNKDWALNDGVINLVNEKSVAYLCNTKIWSGYKDSEGKARYAIGGVPIEMWVDSYNKFILINSNNLVKPSGVTGTMTGELETRWKASNGYQIGLVGDNYSNSKGNRTANYTIMRIADQTSNDMKARLRMYNTSGDSYRLASPSSESSSSLLDIYDNNRYTNNIGTVPYTYVRKFCTLISIKSQVTIEEVK